MQGIYSPELLQVQSADSKVPNRWKGKRKFSLVEKCFLGFLKIVMHHPMTLRSEGIDSY